MTQPTYDIRADWAGDGDFTDTGDDISARVFDRGTPLTVSYGRDQGRTFAPMTPGRGQFELNNESRDYSPENLASPLAGNLLPGRDVRIQATHLGVTYGLLRGFTDDYKVLPDLEQKAVQITVVDALSRLQQTQVSTPLYHSVQTGTAIGLLLDAVGWDPDLRDLDVGASTLPWWWCENADAWNALQQIVDSEGPGALVSVDVDGRVVFRDRHHRLTRTASNTAQATLRASGMEPCFSGLDYDHGWKEVINQVTINLPVRAPAGTPTAVWQLQGTYSIADGQTVLLSAQASEPFTSAIVPVAGTDYELVSGTVEVTLSRTSGQAATVFVKAVGGPAIVADLQVRAYAVQTLATVQISVEDSTSIGTPDRPRYGRRSWPSDRDPVFASAADAEAIANLVLAQRAERLPAVTMTLQGGISTRLVQQLGRDLSDRIRIVEPETGIDGDFWIEQIQHTIGEDLSTVFGCEKIPAAQTGVLILDDAVLGKLNEGKLGGIGLSEHTTVYRLDEATQGQLNVGLLGF